MISQKDVPADVWALMECLERGDVIVSVDHRSVGDVVEALLR